MIFEIRLILISFEFLVRRRRTRCWRVRASALHTGIIFLKKMFRIVCYFIYLFRFLMIHLKISVVFAGFSATALADRINDADSRSDSMFFF